MAGTLKTDNLQLGDSLTATNNFVLKTNADGTAKLARGNVGATTQDILTVDADGKVTSDQVYTPAGTGAVATTVQTKLRESVSVKDFGAVGDGMANDYAAFVAALAAANCVHIPEGTFYLASTLTISSSGKTLSGPGTIKGNSALAANSQVINVTGSNVTLKDFTINQNNINAGRSIWISGANVVVDGVKSYNTQSAFIELRSGASNVVVRNCYQNGGGYGVISSDHGLGAVRVENNTFIHPGVGYAIGDGIEFNNPTTGSQNIQIIGNYVDGYKGAANLAGLGIGIAKGTYCIVASNIVKNCEADGIHVEDQSSFIVVEGNIVEDCCTDVTYGSAGILLYLTNNSVIANNIVKGASGGHGIMVSGFGQDQYVYNNKVIGNHVSTVREAGIFLNTTNRTIVANNVVESANQASLGFGCIDLRRIGTATKYNIRVRIQNNIFVDGFPVADSGVKAENGDTGYLFDNDFVNVGTKINIGSANIRVKRNQYSATAQTGNVTLAAGVTTTTVTNDGVYSRVRIRLTPINASAAAMTGVWVSAAPLLTSFTITHPTATGTEQFYYELE